MYINFTATYSSLTYMLRDSEHKIWTDVLQETSEQSKFYLHITDFGCAPALLLYWIEARI